MNQNIHAFAQPRMEPLYRAAERLSDDELEKRIGMYEARQTELDEKHKQRNLALRIYDLGAESRGVFIPAIFTLGLSIVPFILAGLAGMAYDKLTENKPLILDNVNPLVNPEDAYHAAVEVRNFRRKEQYD